jgi:hypothetical protein
MFMRFGLAQLCFSALIGISAFAAEFDVTENDQEIRIGSATLEGVVHKKGYVTGIAAGTFLDKKTGFRDAGYGLDIVDWIMEPGSDEAYRDKLPGDLPYVFGNRIHGGRAKRSIEGPQICTKANELTPRVIRGTNFLAIKMDYHYRLAAPGKKTGSIWEQTIVFPAGKRYFVSCDKITSVNSSDAMFLRLDMPGHIKHKGPDTFSEVWLSYFGRIPATQFTREFAPDQKFNYVRGANMMPKRFIRAYHLRDPKTGADGPWLAGMTLEPSVVYEAWCHERGYVCMIEEFGGRPIKAGESFSAAFVVGYFDSFAEMEEVYDQYAGNTALEASESGWKLVK